MRARQRCCVVADEIILNFTPFHCLSSSIISNGNHHAYNLIATLSVRRIRCDRRLAEPKDVSMRQRWLTRREIGENCEWRSSDVWTSCVACGSARIDDCVNVYVDTGRGSGQSIAHAVKHDVSEANKRESQLSRNTTNCLLSIPSATVSVHRRQLLLVILARMTLIDPRPVYN